MTIGLRDKLLFIRSATFGESLGVEGERALPARGHHLSDVISAADDRGRDGRIRVRRCFSASLTETALRVFLQTPHTAMPDLRPTPEQTDNLIAYILGLKGRRSGI